MKKILATLLCGMFLFSATAMAVSTDTCYDPTDTSLMLHMDGSDASTTFTDESGHTFTAYNSAQIDTAQSKFGGASGLFDENTADYIDTPDSADFTLGTGDWTFDLWVKRASSGTRDMFFGSHDSTGGGNAVNCEFQSDNTVQCIVFKTNPVIFIAQSTATFTDTNWHHIALVRTGDTVKLFIDGTQDGSVSLEASMTVLDSTQPFALGRSGAYNGLYMNGHLDEMRLVLGTAIWTTNFTPPTAAYTECSAASTRNRNALIM